MEVDHVVDERRDPFRSSQAAAELDQVNQALARLAHDGIRGAAVLTV